eukprot:gene33545-43351_t
MNKKDSVLAQKCLAARQVKIESKISKEILKLGNNHNVPSPSSTLNLSKSLGSLNLSGLGSFSRETSLPEISSPVNLSSKTEVSGKDILSPMEYKVIQNSESSAKLIDELSAKTKFRKLQATIKKDINDKLSNDMIGSLNSSGGEGRPRAQTAAQTSRYSDPPSTANQRNPQAPPNDDNLFMPKVTILRPDGASLLDVYESKKKDYWGRIVKAQYLEDERVQRERELIDEITTSTLMVNKAKAAIVQEAKKKEDLKQYHKNYQDRVYQNEKQFLKETVRREQENLNKLQKAAEGPAHKVVRAWVRVSSGT